MTSALFSEVVKLRVRGEVATDRYGRVTSSEPDVDTPWPAYFEPRGSSEDTAAAEQYISGLWLFAPTWHVVGGERVSLASVLTPADAVVVTVAGQDIEYEVVGEPGYSAQGFTLDSFARIALERGTG